MFATMFLSLASRELHDDVSWEGMRVSPRSPRDLEGGYRRTRRFLQEWRGLFSLEKLEKAHHPGRCVCLSPAGASSGCHHRREGRSVDNSSQGNPRCQTRARLHSSCFYSTFRRVPSHIRSLLHRRSRWSSSGSRARELINGRAAAWGYTRRLHGDYVN